MTLVEKLLEERKMSRRNFLGLVGALGAGLALGSCSEPEKKKKKNPAPPANQTPTLDIGMDFGNGYNRNVSYLFSAADDQSVGVVKASVNGGEWTDYLNGQAISVPIVDGNNTIEAYVIDNMGLAGANVRKSFIPATEAEARAKIYSMLSATPNGGINNEYTGPNQTEYKLSGHFADFIVEPLPSVPSGDVIIEYIGESDNFAQEMDDKNYFGTNGIPNLYMAKLPLFKIEEEVAKFINQNWQ